MSRDVSKDDLQASLHVNDLRRHNTNEQRHTHL